MQSESVLASSPSLSRFLGVSRIGNDAAFVTALVMVVSFALTMLSMTGFYLFGGFAFSMMVRLTLTMLGVSTGGGAAFLLLEPLHA
jgi:hypothetical protein